MNAELLTAKELAVKLKRSADYIYWMKRRGFKMVAGTSTLKRALAWLEKHPFPSRRDKKPQDGPAAGHVQGHGLCLDRGRAAPRRAMSGAVQPPRGAGRRP